MANYEYNEFLLRSIMEKKDIIPGGLADDAKDSEFDPEQLKAGIKSELEHTSDEDIAKEIAQDHLKEDPTYYTKLKNMEAESIVKNEEIIAEKQSAKQRHAKHKEWREKNPQKVRDQVARHQSKTGQNKNREDTRQAKNRGEKSKNPTCANCGSKVNVEYDHDKGYAKGASTTPRCHKCHTNRPQQNDEGEKSVKGGTVRVSKEALDKSLIKLISENINYSDNYKNERN